MTHRETIPNAGNVLFIILIAIALFAALSYIVSSSTRVNGKSSIADEKVRMSLSSILQYGDLIRTAMQRMEIIGGVPDEKLDFGSDARILTNGSPDLSWDNTLCTESKCEIHNPAGGGVPVRIFSDISTTPSAWGATWEAPGSATIWLIGIDGIGSELPEIVLRVVGINESMCRAINTKLGLPESPTGVNSAQWAKFSGDPTVALANTAGKRFSGQLARQQMGCVINSGWGDFFYVLKER